jgi:hypothetical protein
VTDQQPESAQIVPSYLLKLDRGRAHLAAVDAAVDAWLQANACKVVGARVGDTAEYVLRARIAAQPPSELSLLIGDCAHALRSALDHLAFQLATAYTPSPLPDGIARTSEFPIFDDPTAYQRAAERKLRGVDPRAKDLIETMQPYHGGDWELLAFVHELDRIDKHRALNVTVANTEQIQINVRYALPLQSVTLIPPGPVEDGQQLVSYIAEPSDPRRPVEHEHHARLGVAVAEGRFARWWASERLHVAATLIRDRVTPALAPFT